ncbi:MAG: glycosyltransferase [Lachnospiraceae bacterium]|nr:glycosyltransferase [Lachnospiraceae bacterium]
MNVLYLDWPCFGVVDCMLTLEKTFSCRLTKFSHKDYLERESPDFDRAFDAAAKERRFDFAFSYNFYPLFAEGCHRHSIPYISIVYDSPFVKLYSRRLLYPTNHVYLFDNAVCQELRARGIETVHYTVLPVNSDVIRTMLKKPYDRKRTMAEVSFVGALYNEEYNLFDQLNGKLEPYMRGFLSGIMEAQLLVSGYSFIEELLTDEVVEKLEKAEPVEAYPDGMESKAYGYANYYIARKLTAMERERLLTKVGERFPLKLFTLDPDARIPGAVNMGITDYYNEMPYVFHNSRINLNISLRSIKSGIPLRCMDIFGAGGFLLSNYQADLAEAFVPGEEFVYFEDAEDLIRKIDYFLSHESERARIAENGHRKAKEKYSFEKVFRRILEESL